MRRTLIAGNWKMYKTINEAVELATKLKRDLALLDKADIVVCPAFTALASVYDVLMDTNIGLGAQNLHWDKEGAFTGEVSPIMVKDCGCEYVIIGHSERRKYFSETDVTVNSKLDSALAIGLLPIVCVGETLEEREANQTTKVIEAQLDGGFKDLSQEDIVSVVIAYEPVWAIGTGKTATPDQAQTVHSFIRSWLTKKYSEDISKNIRILYGGSVKPENIAELMQKEDIDGALVGGASLKASTFVEIVKNSLIDK